MPISDLLGKRARTASGVEVSAPTVRNYFLALELFGREIWDLRAAARKLKLEHGREFTIDQALSQFLATQGDGRLAEVLDGLASPPNVDLEGVARAVAETVAPLAAKIDALLGDPDGEPYEDADDIKSGNLVVFRVMEKFPQDPRIIVNWPLGFFLDAWIALSRPPKTTDDRMAKLAEMAPGPMGRPTIVGGPSYPDAAAS